MEIIEIIRTLYGSMDSEYIQENDEKIIDLLGRAAHTLEQLVDENKQLRRDLIMQTALAHNQQNTIERLNELMRWANNGDKYITIVPRENKE